MYKTGIISQYSKTNVMHYLFNLLRIKALYMFRALLANLQEALHKQHVVRVYCCIWNSNPGAANRHNTRALYQVLFV
jgi:hypothetical protein